MGRRVMRRQIWDYSVCLCHIKRPPGLYGLMRPVTLYLGRIVSYFAFGAKAVPYSTTRSAIYTHKKN